MYWEDIPSPVKTDLPPSKRKREKPTSTFRYSLVDIADAKSAKTEHNKERHVAKKSRKKSSGSKSASKDQPQTLADIIKFQESLLNVATTKQNSIMDVGDKETKLIVKKIRKRKADTSTRLSISADKSDDASSETKTSNTTPKSHKKKTTNTADKKKSGVNDKSTNETEEVKFLTLSDVILDPTPIDKALKTPSQFSGNIDDTGSVASGVLEEDICFECGVSTMSDMLQNNVIMCDICDAEYHLKCVNLERIPRSTFVCPKCDKEAFSQRNLRFNVQGEFQITKRSREPRAVVYSPSKPLELAWEECQKKGLMVVSEVFSYDLMQKLTHGRLDKLTKSGRVAESWLGATEEVGKRLHSSVCEGLVDREGRYDLDLPQFVVDQLELDKVLAPILEKLSSVMGTPSPQVRTHNVVFVPVGSKPQKWHVDDTVREGKLHRYFTILIHLNSLDSCCGGTEMWIEKQQCGDMVRSRPGDAFVFNGSLLHRGQANLGKVHRFFYYASFACKADTNTGNV